jgi:hypothetical protein
MWFLALCGYICLVGAGALVFGMVAGPLLLPAQDPGVVLSIVIFVCHCILDVGYHRIAGRGVRCPSLDMLFI